MANALYYGDNLAVLRDSIASESVDLIYLDPPFNSQATYNLLFKGPSGKGSDAQIEAFEDTWHWGDEAERAFSEVLDSLEHPSGGTAEGAAIVSRRERHDGRAPYRTAPSAEADGLALPALRPDGQSLFEDSARFDLCTDELSERDYMEADARAWLV